MSFPSTSNVQRAALVCSSKKLGKVLGDVPRIVDDVPMNDNESTWCKRKSTHLPPPLKLSPSPRASVLSVAPSIISNAPSSASGSSMSDITDHRRTKLERLRRKLGDEVPATAIFPPSPRTAVPRTPRTAAPSSSRGRTRSTARNCQDDACSIAFSISSDESIHTVTLSARVRVHSPHPSRSRPKHVYQTGPLPPVPSIPAHNGNDDGDDQGLVRPRQKMPVGSRIGGSAFKAARRAKREGRVGEVGEGVEMVGFLF